MKFNFERPTLINIAGDDVQFCLAGKQRPEAYIQEKWDHWRDRYDWSDALYLGFVVWRKAFNQKWREFEYARERLLKDFGCIS